MLSVPNPRPAIENAIEYINACKTTGIKKYPVRFSKKGKTRGRPSKGEIWASQTISKIFESEPFQKSMAKKLEESMITGQYQITDQEIEEILNKTAEGE